MKRFTASLSFIATLFFITAFIACDSDSSDDKKADTTEYTVSGTITLPGGDTLADGYYEIYVNGENTGIKSWASGNAVDYSFEIRSGRYNTIDIYVFNSGEDLAYSCHTTSAGLVVAGADVTGFDFAVARAVTYTVSGTMRLPDGVTGVGGFYKIVFTGTSRGEEENVWISGNTHSYSVQLEAGTYDRVEIEVSDSDDVMRYRYSTDSLGLAVDGDVPNVNFVLVEVEFHTVSGTITLPGSDTLAGGYYEITIEGDSYGYDGGSWASGHTLSYSMELLAGTYNEVNIEIEDASSETVYVYRSESLGLTVTGDRSNVNFTVAGFASSTVSGTISLPGGETLTDGYYEIYFEGPSYYETSGIWASGGTQEYSIELEPGTYSEVYVDIYDDSSWTTYLYEYHTSSAGIVVSDHDVTGVDFTVEEVID